MEFFGYPYFDFFFSLYSQVYDCQVFMGFDWWLLMNSICNTFDVLSRHFTFYYYGKFYYRNLLSRMVSFLIMYRWLLFLWIFLQNIIFRAILKEGKHQHSSMVFSMITTIHCWFFRKVILHSLQKTNSMQNISFKSP